MKRPVIIVAILLAGMAVLLALLMFNPFRPSIPETFDPAQVEAMTPARQQALVESLLKSETLTLEEGKRIVAWGYVNQPGHLVASLQETGARMRLMPRILSEVALDMLRDGEPENAVALRNLARRLYPNDPHVLGVSGIFEFLAGNTAEARRLLEQAESWRQDIPLVNFYLGAVLNQSTASADRTRGKTLMMRVVNGKDPELSELAGLAILTNPDVPVLAVEFQQILAIFEALSVLRPDNPNLNVDILRILANSAIRHAPEKALPLTDLLFEFPGTTVEDQLATVQLAQNAGELAVSRKMLADLDANALKNAESGPLLARLSAIQDMLDGRHAEGLARFRELAQTQPAEPRLHEAFRIVLEAGDIPLEAERELLRTYLNLPIESIPLSLAVLSRLMEIEPLKEQEWTDYVAQKLLPREIDLSARWLARFEQSGKVIEVLEGVRPDAERDATIALAEAYLAQRQLDQATELMRESGGRLSPALFEYYHSRIALRAGDTAAAFERWQAAHNAAVGSSDFPLLQNLGFLALELDQPVNAMQSLYTAFSSGIGFNLPQLGQLMNLTLRHGNLAQTIRIAEVLREQYPDQPVHRNNLAYFRFLAQQDVENSVEVMRDLVDDHPDVAQYRLTLALGLLRLGRHNEAKRLLDSTRIDWERTSTQGQVIYAAVLAANQQQVVASGLIQNIDLSSLIPEERALIQSN
jgi:tetratricopeptide (TPR) repeat protein